MLHTELIYESGGILLLQLPPLNGLKSLDSVVICLGLNVLKQKKRLYVECKFNKRSTDLENIFHSDVILEADDLQ